MLSDSALPKEQPYLITNPWPVQINMLQAWLKLVDRCTDRQKDRQKDLKQYVHSFDPWFYCFSLNTDLRLTLYNI